MGAKLRALLDLQDIELQIVDIRRQLRRKERIVGAQTRKLEAIRAEYEAEREEIRRSQVAVDGIDLDLKGRTAHAERLRKHLNSVRTNKEYAAVLAQLNNEKADVSRLESRALQMMEQIDARKQAITEREQACAAQGRRLEELKTQLADARKAFADKLEDLQRRRTQAADSMDAKSITLFERLSAHYDGEVMAEVQRVNLRRDEFVCGGCHMALATELASALKIRDEVLTCGNCGRILFIEKDT